MLKQNFNVNKVALLSYRQHDQICFKRGRDTKGAQPIKLLMIGIDVTPDLKESIKSILLYDF